MIWIVAGFLIGISFGAISPFAIPAEYARYTAVSILAILDSAIGALRAEIQKDYSSLIFISGLIFNMLFAALIVWFGDRLGLDLYLAVIVVLTLRILQNVGIIRRFYVLKYLKPETERRSGLPDRRYKGEY